VRTSNKISWLFFSRRTLHRLGIGDSDLNRIRHFFYLQQELRAFHSNAPLISLPLSPVCHLCSIYAFVNATGDGRMSPGIRVARSARDTTSLKKFIVYIIGRLSWLYKAYVAAHKYSTNFLRSDCRVVRCRCLPIIYRLHLILRYHSTKELRTYGS